MGNLNSLMRILKQHNNLRFIKTNKHYEIHGKIWFNWYIIHFSPYGPHYPGISHYYDYGLAHDLYTDCVDGDYSESWKSGVKKTSIFKKFLDWFVGY